MKVRNVLPGVLDVRITEDNQSACGRGGMELSDPRLLLLGLPEREAFVMDRIADGTMNMANAIWLTNVTGD